MIILKKKPLNLFTYPTLSIQLFSAFQVSLSSNCRTFRNGVTRSKSPIKIMIKIKALSRSGSFSPRIHQDRIFRTIDSKTNGGTHACSCNCRILALFRCKKSKRLSLCAGARPVMRSRVIHNLHTSRHRTGAYDSGSRPHPIKAIELVFGGGCKPIFLPRLNNGVEVRAFNFHASVSVRARSLVIARYLATLRINSTLVRLR